MLLQGLGCVHWNPLPMLKRKPLSSIRLVECCIVAISYKTPQHISILNLMNFWIYVSRHLEAQEINFFQENAVFLTCTWINSILDRHIECRADCWWLIWHCSAEQEGITANPIELSQFVNFMKRNNLQTETFVIGPNECKLNNLWLSSPISLSC